MHSRILPQFTSLLFTRSPALISCDPVYLPCLRLLSSFGAEKERLWQSDRRERLQGVQAGALGQDALSTSERTFSHEHTFTHGHA